MASIPVPTGEEFDDVRRRAAITNEQFLSLLAVLLSNGVITPDQKDFVLQSTGHHADIDQPPAPPLSGVPTGGA